MLAVGKKAPDFALQDSSGTTVSLKDFTGNTLVLYFYPKDKTPGCTREACDFRDNFARISATGAVVLGVSADSVESHRSFREKFDLPFELLSDESHSMLNDYEVWREKKLYGKTFMGIVRTTVIIDGAGIVTHLFPNVKVNGHVEQVLAALSPP